MRIAFFFDGVFIPERDGASARFARLPAAIHRTGLGVCVFHAFRGWSDLQQIAAEPYPTYFFPPNSYHNSVSLLADLLRREQIDIVQMNDLELVLNMGIRLAEVTGVKLVFEAIYHSSTLAAQLGLPETRQRVLRSLEREVAASVDHIIAFTAPDRQRWVDISGAEAERVSVVPFGVDRPAVVNSCWIGRPSVVFIGNGYFEPNRRAVERIVTDIWPTLRTCADASCLIIGSMPLSIRKICIDAGVEVSGEVSDPTMFIRSRAIGLAPVQEGSGVRVKILHYLASGLPVIATSTAAEGMAFPALVIEDRISAYADIIQDLVANSERVDRLVLESLDLLTLEYSWQQIAETAKETYSRVINRSAREKTTVIARVDSVPMWLQEALESGRFAACDDFGSVGYRYGEARDGAVKMY